MGLPGMLPTRVRICRRHSLASSREHLAGRQSLDGSVVRMLTGRCGRHRQFRMRTATVTFGAEGVDEDDGSSSKRTDASRDPSLSGTMTDRRHQRESAALNRNLAHEAAAGATYLLDQPGWLSPPRLGEYP